MKLFKIVSAICLTIVFTACGGSGGEDSSLGVNSKSIDNTNQSDNALVQQQPAEDNRFYKVSALAKSIRVNGKVYQVVPYINSKSIPSSEKNSAVFFSFLDKDFSIDLPGGLNSKKIYLSIKDEKGTLLTQTDKTEIIDGIRIGKITLKETDDMRPSFLKKFNIPVPPVF